MKKVLFLFFLLILIFVIWVQYASTPTTSPQNSVYPIENKGDNNVSRTITMPLSPAINKAISKTDIVSSQNTEAKVESIMYTTIPLEEALLSTKPRKNIPAIAAIKIEHEIFNHVKLQDTIILSDIEGEDYPLIITNIQKHNDGSASITCSLKDEGIRYTTTITQSENETFISLSTPKGLYEIESSNTIGYIYRTKDIRRQMQRKPLNDVIIFPIPKK